MKLHNSHKALFTRKKEPDAATKKEEGAVIVEFALILPLVIMLVVGIVDYGWMMRQKSLVINATRAGARAAATYDMLLDPNIHNCIQLNNVAVEVADRYLQGNNGFGLLPTINFSSSIQAIVPGGTNYRNCMLKLRATGELNCIMCIGRDDLSLSYDATFRLEDQQAFCSPAGPPFQHLCD